MKAVIIIPARLESTRLPRKLLLNETGKPLIQHTWEQSCKTGLEVEIVTDSVEVMSACAQAGFGASCSLSCGGYRNGTERVAAFVEGLDDYDVIVNWQSDEPEIQPIDVKNLVENYDDGIWTLAGRISSDRAHDPNRTKVVTDDVSRALYFSRAEIPYNNDPVIPIDLHFWQHIGIYAYSRNVLQFIASLPVTSYERAEQLEQLRWLQSGQAITVMPIRDQFNFPIGINTREDYDAFVERQKVMALIQ